MTTAVVAIIRESRFIDYNVVVCSIRDVTVFNFYGKLNSLCRFFSNKYNTQASEFSNRITRIFDDVIRANQPPPPSPLG